MIGRGLHQLFCARAPMVRCRRLARDQRGNVAVTLGLLLPVLAAAVAAGMDYTNAASTRSKMQAVADSAALSATREFQMAQSNPDRITAVAQKYVTSQLNGVTAK